MASTRSSDSERPGSEDAGQNRYPNPFLEFSHKVRSDFQLGRNHPGQQAWVKMEGDEIHIILQDETDYVVDSNDEHYTLAEWNEIKSLIRSMSEGEYGLELPQAQNRPEAPLPAGNPETLTDDEAVDGVFEVNIGPEDEIVEEPHNGRRNDH
ncbi:hypothetical protein QAD02_015004 [Eretmocerus hayati]|uniref:Uncharacterized protein n=1 Tax=Eretmocerus hayati TaxID=131215 RepID=A0ACC2P6Z2_9HYME|nr:hypothetical protein QAD02_015004 [Eretmocerus hayati]